MTKCPKCQAEIPEDSAPKPGAIDCPNCSRKEDRKWVESLPGSSARKKEKPSPD